MIFKSSFASLLIATAFLAVGPARAQQIPGVEETGIVYRKTSNTGVSLHSSGFGINYRHGRRTSGFSSRMADFALFGIRHPKEVKSVNPFSEARIGYVYGKQNNFLVLRTGIGEQRALFARGDKGGVEISFGYFGGLSWGIAKPVYLSIYYNSDNMGLREKIEKYNPQTHYPDNISGRASFFRGISESRLHPGLYGEINLNFEFGPEQHRLRMIETGVSVDAFSRIIPIMAESPGYNPNNRLFLHFFVRALMGKLWN